MIGIKTSVPREIDHASVHLWKLDNSTSRNIRSNYLNTLTEEERAISRKFRYEQGLNSYITGRAVLRILSASYLSCTVKAVEFDYNSYGKPFYTRQPHLKFNLAHSGNKIIIGFMLNGEIGVDIEYIRPEINHRELAKTVFSESEIKLMDQLNDQDAAQKFYELWTRKEAFIKGTGYGLSIPIKLKSLSVLEDQVEFHQSKSELPLLLNEDWVLRSMDLEPDYRVAVAFNGKPRKVKCFSWDHPKS